MKQACLFSVKRPVVVANGVGVDSWAMLIGMRQRDMRPDLILHADVGNEKRKTREFLPIMNRHLISWGFPEITVVRYVPKNFKHWPPYYTLAENCLTNGTLPSISFGFKSCSLKWKKAPQDAYCNQWAPALECWASGQRVIKLIGYDTSPKDVRRCNHVGDPDDPKYEYRYPLQEWGWNRERCIAEIRRARLPVPVKSSCVMCAAMKPDEVRELDPDELALVVVMEARAKPRLRNVEGLWRKSTKARPGSMTEFILREKLLPAAEVERLQQVPTDLVRYQQEYACGQRVEPFSEFIQITLANRQERSRTAA
jgi:hypothetical protein